MFTEIYRSKNRMLHPIQSDTCCNPFIFFLPLYFFMDSFSYNISALSLSGFFAVSFLPWFFQISLLSFRDYWDSFMLFHCWLLFCLFVFFFLFFSAWLFCTFEDLNPLVNNSSFLQLRLNRILESCLRF